MEQDLKDKEQYDGDEEMGESEMSEEEDDEELVSEEEEGKEEDDKIPKVIPVNHASINHTRKPDESNSNISDIDPDNFSDSSEYESDEFAENNLENPHGFVYGSMLDSYKKNKKERVLEMRENFDRDEHRNKFKKKKKSKNIGKSERVHQKNKPFMMVKKKKIEMLRESIQGKPFKKRGADKRQLGKFKKNQVQRIEAKKLGRK